MQYVTFAIAIIGSVISVTTFFDNKKTKSNKDIAKEQYEKGKLDSTLSTIMEKLDKIEKKLDNYDKDTDDRINIALDHHVKEYHSRQSSSQFEHLAKM